MRIFYQWSMGAEGGGRAIQQPFPPASRLFGRRMLDRLPLGRSSKRPRPDLSHDRGRLLATQEHLGAALSRSLRPPPSPPSRGGGAIKGGGTT